MKSIGLITALKLCKNYQKMNSASRNALCSQRLAALPAYVREHSPYYAKLYSNLLKTLELAMLSPIKKPELMAHWDDWVTDRSVTLADVTGFMSTRENLGKKLQGKYQVYTTSGSTGNPLVMLCDKTTANVTNAISFCRSYARNEDMKAFISKG